MQTTEIRETWTALYARLSLDDGNVGESMSIQSQKAILTRKAEELGMFDNWASTFGETITALELSPEGYTLIGR